MILFLLPTEAITAYAKKVLAGPFPDIKTECCLPRDVMKRLPWYIEKGVRVIACRAGITHVLRENKTNIPVVDIQISTFEIIRAINKAKAENKRIAVLAHAAMVIGIEYIASSLGIDMKRYEVVYNQDYERAVRRAVEDGAEIIVGGALACEAATCLNVPCSPLRYGEESLLQASKEAAQILEALEKESAKNDIFRVVMEASADGIITVDEKNLASAVNSSAEKILGQHKNYILGRDIATVLPLPKDVKKNLASGVEETILPLKKGNVVCEITPIRQGTKRFGAVLTLQQVSRIQQKEAKIRGEIYARGHVARFTFADIIGDSPAMRDAVARAGNYAGTDASVLILGETGTGKEVFAQSIHNSSARAAGPFVAVNCAALPIQLLESELFGYVGGAFTGANREGKPGLFEIAHGGTIFLDEMAEMDFANQGRLLRFYQERTVVRLGSHTVTPVDVRVIVATNKNLEEMVKAKTFRDDLYYRLNVLRLTLPPLRHRKSDIRQYIAEFLRQHAEALGKLFRLSAGAYRLLEQHPWPGNVRECRNIMERMVVECPSGLISEDMARAILTPQRFGPVPQENKTQRMQREILKALEETRGNKARAAPLLGMHRTTLCRWIKKLGIDY